MIRELEEEEEQRRRQREQKRSKNWALLNMAEEWNPRLKVMRFEKVNQNNAILVLQNEAVVGVLG